MAPSTGPSLNSPRSGFPRTVYVKLHYVESGWQKQTFTDDIILDMVKLLRWSTHLWVVRARRDYRPRSGRYG